MAESWGALQGWGFHWLSVLETEESFLEVKVLELCLSKQRNFSNVDLGCPEPAPESLMSSSVSWLRVECLLCFVSEKRSLRVLSHSIVEVSESSSVPTGHSLKQSLLASFASPGVRGQLVVFKAAVHREERLLEEIPGRARNTMSNSTFALQQTLLENLYEQRHLVGLAFHRAEWGVLGVVRDTWVSWAKSKLRYLYPTSDWEPYLLWALLTLL